MILDFSHLPLFNYKYYTTHSNNKNFLQKSQISKKNIFVILGSRYLLSGRYDLRTFKIEIYNYQTLIYKFRKKIQLFFQTKIFHNPFF